MEDGLLVSTPDLRPSLLSILSGLVSQGLLSRVVTTLAPTGAQLAEIQRIPGVGTHLSRKLERRRVPPFLEGLTESYWQREFLRSVVALSGAERLTHRVWCWAETGFDRAVAARYAGRYRIVYGMEHSSLATFTAQKASGQRCVLRQVSTHARDIIGVLQRETQRFPAYTTSYHRLLLSEAEPIVERKEREYALADLIVCNSTHVRQTFIDQGIAPDKLVAIPTGCPAPREIASRSGAGHGPLRFLYVGTLSLRKGFPYLAAAWSRIAPRVEAALWIAGTPEISPAAAFRDAPGVHYRGRLDKQALAQLFHQSDVLVLPTLSEGLAHVILEALSHGLPIITTQASGCGDLVVDGDNGWVVPGADDQLLSEAMLDALEQRSRLPIFGARSRDKAAAWSVSASNDMHLQSLQGFMEKGSV